MSTSVFLTQYLGILEPVLSEPPGGIPDETRELGNFELAVYGQTGVLRCQCGRQDPIALRMRDVAHAAPIRGMMACATCIAESRTNPGRSKLIQAWFRRRKLAINPDEHLYLPESLHRLVDDEEIMRPRRYIYKVFFNCDLTTEDKVLCSCGDQSCLNPYHMMIGKSPARKMTPEMLEAVQAWLKNGKTTKSVVELLKIKFQKSFSIRTIQSLKKEFQQSGFTKSSFSC